MLVDLRVVERQPLFVYETGAEKDALFASVNDCESAVYKTQDIALSRSREKSQLSQDVLIETIRRL